MSSNKTRHMPATLCATAIICLSSQAFGQAAAYAPAAPAETPTAATQQPAPGFGVGAPTNATDDRGMADPTIVRPWNREGRFFLVPKLGIGIGGSVEREETETCSASYSGCDAPKKDDWNDSSSVMLGVDALYGVTPTLRLGVGAQYVPSRTADSGDIEVGSDLSAFGVAELVIEASPSLALALRAQAGGVLLFPGGDMQEDIDAELESCNSMQTGRCEVGEGPFPGLTYGFGAGAIAPMGNMTVRVDALYSAYSIDRLRETEDLGAGGSKEEREKVTGHKIWLTAGLEL